MNEKDKKVMHSKIFLPFAKRNGGLTRLFQSLQLGELKNFWDQKIHRTSRIIIRRDFFTYSRTKLGTTLTKCDKKLNRVSFQLMRHKSKIIES